MATPTDPLLTARAALVLLFAVLIGVAAGYLSFDGGAGWQSATIVGGGAFGGGLLLLHTVID